MADTFFNEQKEQSLIKSRIVSQYFGAWAKVMLGAMKRHGGDRLVYADLFCGPGRYADGARSTPLMVAQTAIANPDLARRLVMLFNDAEPDHVRSLEKELSALPGVDRLANAPRFFASAVDDELNAIITRFGQSPKFSFIDPWGYSGLSQGVIRSAIRDWGSDCVFFFNYGRINAAIANDHVRPHMDALFGHDRIERLRAGLAGTSPRIREQVVLEELGQALKALGGKFILPFRFRREDSVRVSHALIFVSKHILGYEIMKDIMARASSTTDQGVASFEYAPADARCPMLFSYARPLEGLVDELHSQFQGRRMRMIDVYRQHHVGTPFVKKNYREALLSLEGAGRLTVHATAQRRHGSLGEDVWVSFVQS
jgi:three-Cys-motif partner protein